VLTLDLEEAVMYLCCVASVLTVALLLPRMSSAQAYPIVQIAPPQIGAPQVTAAGAPWQIRNEPIIVQSIVYYPTSVIRPFDANVMIRTGTYEGVPIYSDVTLEAFSLAYVPVSRGGMREYERLRDGELAMTTGSRTPTYPVAPISAVPREERIIATSGTIVGRAGTLDTSGTPGTPSTLGTPGTRGHVESIPRPRSNDGIWIQFDGAKWYSDGDAAPYSGDRFTKVGDYCGFPVYRAKNTKKNQIWVAVVQDGPVAPYAKR
jgi:hypothetical protein